MSDLKNQEIFEYAVFQYVSKEFFLRIKYNTSSMESKIFLFSD